MSKAKKLIREYLDGIKPGKRPTVAQPHGVCAPAGWLHPAAHRARDGSVADPPYDLTKGRITFRAR